MSILGKIFNFIKTGFTKIVEIFKDKKPVEFIDDVSKAVVGVATIGTVAVAIVNVVRSLFMNKKNKQTSDNGPVTGADIVMNNRVTGTPDEKIVNLRQNSEKMSGKYAGLTNEEVNILEEVAKTRNDAFRSMTPAEQLQLLKLEGFDFAEFREKMNRENTTGRIRKSSRRVGEKSPEDKSFREPVDYGKLNFIMRPLDDFICWLRNDPTPKPVKQIHLINRDEIPDVSIAAQKTLDHYFETLNANSKEKSPEVVSQTPSLSDLQEKRIYAEEVFKHKNLRKFRKAVKTRMMNTENGLSSQIFELMDQDIKVERKVGKKKKKKKKKDSMKTPYYGVSKKKEKKELKSLAEESDKEAQAIYNHFLKKALKGEQDYSGYHLDRIF